MQALSMQLTSYLNRHLNLPHLAPQSAIFGFLDVSKKSLFHCKPLVATI